MIIELLRILLSHTVGIMLIILLWANILNKKDIEKIDISNFSKKAINFSIILYFANIIQEMIFNIIKG